MKKWNPGKTEILQKALPESLLASKAAGTSESLSAEVRQVCGTDDLSAGSGARRSFSPQDRSARGLWTTERMQTQNTKHETNGIQRRTRRKAQVASHARTTLALL